MILLEIIGQIIVEIIFIDFLGGILIRINNLILRLRGIETRSIEEIKFERLRKRYEYQKVKLKRRLDELARGTKGVVLEIIDLKYCFVEFGKEDKEIKKVQIKDLLLSN